MSDVPEAGLAILALSFVFLALVLLRNVAQPRVVLLWIVGLLAGFDTLQLSGLHLFSLACLLLPFADLRRNRANAWTPALTVAAAVCLASSVLYGSLVNNASLAGQLVVLAASAALVMLFLRLADLVHVLHGLLAAAVLASVYAGLQTLQVLDPNYFLDSSGIPRVHAFFREPDFLAAFVAMGLVLSLRLPLRRAVQVPVAGLLLVTLINTQARGAWLAVVLSLLAAAGRRRLTARTVRERGNRRTAGYVCAGALATGAWLAVDEGLRSNVSRRLLAVLDGGVQDPSLQARSGQAESLAGLLQTAPWHGYGLSAAGRVTGLGQVEYGTSGNNVAANWVLDWMVGGNLLAIPLIVLFVVTALRGAASTPGQLSVLVLANSLFSNLMLLPVAWLVLALTVVALSERSPLPRGRQIAFKGSRLDPATGNGEGPTAESQTRTGAATAG